MSGRRSSGAERSCATEPTLPRCWRRGVVSAALEYSTPYLLFFAELAGNLARTATKPLVLGGKEVEKQGHLVDGALCE